jgi:hypothetical protein
MYTFGVFTDSACEMDGDTGVGVVTVVSVGDESQVLARRACFSGVWSGVVAVVELGTGTRISGACTEAESPREALVIFSRGAAAVAGLESLENQMIGRMRTRFIPGKRRGVRVRYTPSVRRAEGK